jgi:FkbM family methyltransferase
MVVLQGRVVGSAQVNATHGIIQENVNIRTSPANAVRKRCSDITGGNEGHQMRAIHKFFKNRYRFFRKIKKSNSLLLSLNYFLHDAFKTKRLFKLNVFSYEVYVRAGTPDLAVALSSFSGEFDALTSAFHRDHSGLILDIGGYIGTASMIFASAYPKSLIVTVEPSSENFSVLKNNVASFSNVLPIQAALVPEGGPASASLGSRGTGEWGLTLVTNPADQQFKEVESVSTIKVSEILAQVNRTKVSIMKMDIEGSELMLLKEKDFLLPVSVFMIETHDRIVSGCSSALKQASKGRFVARVGEKFISLGPNFFNESESERIV